MANTFTLEGTSLDPQNNAAYVGRYMVLRVTSVGTDTEDQASYPRDSVSFLIDSNGDWTSGATLWVNGDSGIESFYEMVEPSGQRIQFVFPSTVEGTTVRYEFAQENFLVEDAAAQLSPALGAHLADLNNPHVVTPTQLGLVIGTDVQAQSAALDDLDTLGEATTDGEFIVATGAGALAYEAGATARASMGVTIGSDVQAWDTKLDDIAAITPTDSVFLVGNGTTFAPESGDTAQKSLEIQTLTGGCKVGLNAVVNNGSATGRDSFAFNGGASGQDSTASDGFSGGHSASSVGLGVQLSTGTNSVDNTIQFLSSGSVTATQFGKLAATTTSVTTTTYTILATDRTILANNVSGITITLLAAATAGDGFRLCVKNVGSAGTITVDGNASETIDGVATQILTSQYKVINIESDGSNWHIIT